jgi:hypothetical protein
MAKSSNNSNASKANWDLIVSKANDASTKLDKLMFVLRDLHIQPWHQAWSVIQKIRTDVVSILDIWIDLKLQEFKRVQDTLYMSFNDILSLGWFRPDLCSLFKKIKINNLMDIFIKFGWNDKLKQWENIRWELGYKWYDLYISDADYSRIIKFLEAVLYSCGLNFYSDVTPYKKKEKKA